MNEDRYNGENGTENYLDDYFFGPLFLVMFVMVGMIVGNYVAGVNGTYLGFIVAVIIDAWLVRKEWELRSGGSE